MSTDNNINRERLEKTADAVRNRLAETLAAMDQRRHDLTDPKAQLLKHRVPLLAVGGGLLLAVVGGIGSAIFRARHRRERMRAERWRALRRVWTHPERINQAAEPSAFSMAWRKVLTSALTMAGTIALRRLAMNARLLPPPRPQEV